jgi:hypothetical protein
MVRAIRLGGESQFVGQTCALCKQAFDAGDDIIICPEDGARHHVHCWQANGNRCTAYGCRGAGAIGSSAPLVTGVPDTQPVTEDPRRTTIRPAPRPRIIDQAPETPRATRGVPPPPPVHVPVGRTAQADGPPPGSKVRVLPQRSAGCAGSCLFLFVVLAVLLTASACYAVYTFANWAIEQVGAAGLVSPVASALLPLLHDLPAIC